MAAIFCSQSAGGGGGGGGWGQRSASAQQLADVMLSFNVDLFVAV